MPPKGVGFTDPLSKTLKPPFDQRPFLLTLGGLLGLVIGVGGAQLLTLFFPALPVHISWNYLIAAETLAIVIGVIAAVWPARRAAKLNPVDALHSE